MVVARRAAPGWLISRGRRRRMRSRTSTRRVACPAIRVATRTCSRAAAAMAIRWWRRVSWTISFAASGPVAASGGLPARTTRVGACLSGERGARVPGRGDVVSGLVGALLFAAGVGLVWFGALTDLPGRVGAAAAVPRRGAAASELALRVGLPALVLAPVCGADRLGPARGAGARAVGCGGWGVRCRWCCAGAGPSGSVGSGSKHGRPRSSSWRTALEAGLAFPAAALFVAESGPIVASRRVRALSIAASARASSSAALDQLARAPERAAASAAAMLRAAFVDLPTGGVAPVLRELARVLRDRWETRERARTRALSLHREAAILARQPAGVCALDRRHLARLPERLPKRRRHARQSDRRARDLRLLPGDAAARPHPRAGRKREEAMSGIVAGFLVFSRRRAAAGLAPLRGEDAGPECAACARTRRDPR